MAEYKPTSSEESLSEENIESQKGEKKINKGCLLGCIGLPSFLVILTALIAPSFTNMMPKAETIFIKNTLVDIVKTCINRRIEGLSTEFSDIQYLIDEYKSSGKGFTINPYEDDNTCFNLVAYPLQGNGDPLRTWFSISSDFETGEVTKNCGDSSKIYCKKGNSW